MSRPALRKDIAAIVDALIAGSRQNDTISIDAIGAAIGAMAITAEEIDAVFTALENAKRSIGGPQGARGEANLKKVVAAARALRDERGPNGAKPTTRDIAEKAALSIEDVTFALALLRVMQR
jgi:hypothetical protein